MEKEEKKIANVEAAKLEEKKNEEPVERKKEELTEEEKNLIEIIAEDTLEIDDLLFSRCPPMIC